ncbi:MAG TPA: FliM/FliN family flagellar motor switch protein [Kofleriaceae bacterium]|nr:FliM/FliN family flagellar motor switch protein [Kofleriaceae bacterium]
MTRPFPFDRLPQVALAELARTNALARWLALRPLGRRVATLVGGDATVALASGELGDAYAAACELRVHGQMIEVRGASAFVRAFAQRTLGGPNELAAPRPLTDVEQSLWVLLIAAAVEDLGIDGEVWASSEIGTREQGTGNSQFSVPGSVFPILLEARFAGRPCTIELRVPRALVLAVPPSRPPPPWIDHPVDAPIVVGRCQLAREDLARLGRRSVITLDRALAAAELVVLAGAIGLAAVPADPLVARVATEYVPRPMALPDDARVELTVGLGTARLSLRQVMGLAVGEVLPLGRPLAGPFEIRAEGKLIGQGELVDVDGELGVRIVSLAQE